MSVVRKHFWQLASRGAGGLALPKKKGCIWCMPAGVSRTVGSFSGTRLELDIRWCPLAWKKSRNVLRTWSAIMGFQYSDGRSAIHKNVLYFTHADQRRDRRQAARQSAKAQRPQ